ncbi:MAG: methionine adenosyltransferase [Alphaproteobacteria bacterium]|nr:methionine adenosyltransferase [Alphaproteobacteria bacterium]NCQ66424.1 methionine adenosyltransferase [Alphaproteobacteria bacterium]
MTQGTYVFTSESVSEGHPDKICDIVSDALVDAYLERDPYAKLAIETIVTTNLVIIVGEVSSSQPVSKEEREDIIRRCIKDIGYEQEEFHWKHCILEDHLHAQSADIAQGVDLEDGVIGAGDQGMMIGYASNETDSLMPAPLHYSHRILQALSTDRKKGFLPQLGPDAKVQLSFQYENFKPVGVKAVVLSTQHQEGFSAADVREIVRPYVESVLPKGWMCDEDKFYVNPTGRFVIGGPVADSGLTGRKIIVDTYGSAAAHGGGAFSGKDPTKVDRSGAYIARYLAKNIVAAGLAERCTLQVAYGIGIAEPLSLFVDTHGTERCNCEALAAFIARTVDLTPKGIIDRLDLRRPIYKQTASYGHFGRTYEAETKAFPWERTDLAEILRCEFNMPQNVKAYK